MPTSDKDYYSHRGREIENFKSSEFGNATQSVNYDYSHILNQTSPKPNAEEHKSFKSIKSYSNLHEPQDVLERFLGREHNKSKVKKHPTKVFTRLHNQAVVKQKIQKSNDQKWSKEITKKTGKPQTMGHSKSGYLKEQTLYTMDADKPTKICAKKKKKADLDYNANIGHRLYVKSRGLSSKRDRSIHKNRRQKSVRESQQLANPPPQCMSSHSKWILDKKKYLGAGSKPTSSSKANSVCQR